MATAATSPASSLSVYRSTSIGTELPPYPRTSSAATRYPCDDRNSTWLCHEPASSGQPDTHSTVGPSPVTSTRRAMSPFVTFSSSTPPSCLTGRALDGPPGEHQRLSRNCMRRRRRVGLDLVVGRWWLGLEGFIPPPVGALAGGSGHGATAGGGFVGGRASDPALSARPALSVTVRWWAGPVMVMTPRWCSR